MDGELKSRGTAKDDDVTYQSVPKSLALSDSWIRLDALDGARTRVVEQALAALQTAQASLGKLVMQIRWCEDQIANCCVQRHGRRTAVGIARSPRGCRNHS